MDRTFRIHVAAEMCGISEGLIRAWERRYGVLKPKRTPSGYRAYTTADIELLRALKKLTDEGVSIAEAVKLLPRLRREVKERLDTDEVTLPKVPKEQQLAAWKAQILAAGERLDQQAVEAALDEAMASLPPVTFFEEVLAPVQLEVGERWHAGTLTVAEEHVITQAARQRVMTLLHQAPRRARRHVICACFPEETHELGLMGAALRFRHGGWRVTFLGARTPPEHLERVVRAVKPDVVALSCVNDEGPRAFDTVLTELLRAVPKETTVVVGGAAADKHPAIVALHGAKRLGDDEAWGALLEG